MKIRAFLILRVLVVLVSCVPQRQRLDRKSGHFLQVGDKAISHLMLL